MLLLVKSPSVSLQGLTEILASDDLNVRNEAVVNNAAHQWFSNAPKAWLEHLAVHLSKVQTCSVTTAGALTTWATEV